VLWILNAPIRTSLLLRSSSSPSSPSSSSSSSWDLPSHGNPVFSLNYRTIMLFTTPNYLSSEGSSYHGSVPVSDCECCDFMLHEFQSLPKTLQPVNFWECWMPNMRPTWREWSERGGYTTCFLLTLSLLKWPKWKIHQKFQISFHKILRNK